MSSSTTPTTADTMVTLKVNYDGLTRRFKLPLRDMGAGTLEDKLRTILSIPQGANCTVERYSDSAAAYVVLDSSNISVYKQLYRAAKAKQKLKLRITREDVEEKKSPKPVTVEDEPEPERSPSPVKEKPEEIRIMEAAIDSYAATKAKQAETANMVEELREKVMNNLKISQGFVNKIPARPIPQVDEIPVTTGPTARDQWFARCSISEETKSAESVSSTPSEARPIGTVCPATGATFAVCCNWCDKTMPDSHYHCSSCDDGDYDLCQTCIDMGITCPGDDHWLIKRVVRNGQIINSTTETIAPKPVVKMPTGPESPAAVPAPVPAPSRPVDATRGVMGLQLPLFSRTCNSCVQEFHDSHFLHCTACEDFDLCKDCFVKDSHGHHPKHGFAPVVEASSLPDAVTVRLSPGRNQLHNAICDGCDKFIAGVRHKCLDCPDWDYCADCVVNANFVHPNHRFVPIYEQLSEVRARFTSRYTHYGICCDGPLCTAGRTAPKYISGTRYKCAVCNDTDFCANCEASPANTHNKTHPLIKFKTPVRNVVVTTTGEHGDGQRMPQMGDRATRARPVSRSTTASSSATVVSSATTVQTTTVKTVVDVKPSEPIIVKEEIVAEPEEIKQEEPEEAVPLVKSPEQDLVAFYVRDTVTDGTVLPPNHVFEQTWVLQNAGNVAWPAGCSVKFVGGDYMGHVDSNHPAGISELVSASESTICYEPLAPGQEFPFTVLLRTPTREGKIISYWRLTTRDGIKFGHRLWCDVSVRGPKAKEAVEAPKEEVKTEESPVETSSEDSQASSQMIFPKLEKESPESSIHGESVTEKTPLAQQEADDFEDCEDDEWDASEDGFMTDEEYDILDASDEEYLDDQQKKLLKK